jgi:hypothetical protein
VTQHHAATGTRKADLPCVKVPGEDEVERVRGNTLDDPWVVAEQEP